jgi:DNA-binding transcriptional MerR regulator
MGFFIHNYQRFSGNATQLADLAMDCARQLSLPGDISKISERLIRYYVTEGLLSRPIRIGREAEYSYKHLLQFLASRSLMEQGYPMQKVADYISGLDRKELEPLALNQTKPSLAELLVASFRQSEKSSLRPAMQSRGRGFLPTSDMNTMDSIPMMSKSIADEKLDKKKAGSRTSLSSETYLEGMRRTGVVNTRELVNDLKLDITEVKTMMSEVFNSLASTVQPAVIKVSEDAQEKFHEDIQRLRCDLDNLCQKIDSSIHMFMDKQSDLMKYASDMQADMAHRQQMHIQKLEEMIFQLRDEMMAQKFINQKQEK